MSICCFSPDFTMGKKSFYKQMNAVPRRVAYFNELISRVPNDPRRVFIELSCFRGLLYVRPDIVSSETMVYMLRWWDVERECFILKNGVEWHICDEDVARIYGLPYGIGKAPISLDLGENEYSFASEFMARYKISSGPRKNIKDTVLKDKMMDDVLASDERAVDFWRFYILYALSSLLIPTSTPSVSARYLKYLESSEVAEQYNWAALVRDKLVEGLNSFKRKADSGSAPTARPTGDLYCLMHMFFDFKESRKMSERSFTCWLKRSLTVGDLKSVFESNDGRKKGKAGVVSGGGFRSKGMKRKFEVVDDEFMRKKEEIEFDIHRYRKFVDEYSKLLKEKEHALHCLMEEYDKGKKNAQAENIVEKRMVQKGEMNLGEIGKQSGVKHARLHKSKDVNEPEDARDEEEHKDDVVHLEVARAERSEDEERMKAWREEHKDPSTRFALILV